MRNGFLISLLVISGLIAWTAWRFWRILPFPAWGKWAFTVDAMYEKAFGPHRRGATRYYVSSGLGIWGGKFRIGTRSEYIVLKLHN